MVEADSGEPQGNTNSTNNPNTVDKEVKMRKRSSVAVLAAAAALAVALAGCTGGAPATTSTGTGGGGKAIKYLIAQPDTPAALAGIKSDIQAFEKQSGITVTLQAVPGANFKTILQTQLRSGNGPDVFAYGPGPGLAGVLANAGLLYDLTSAYAKNKWPIYDWAKPGITFNGKLYGLPDQVEEVGLFYNKDMFAKLGLSAPTDMASLTHAADVIKKAGIIPFSSGNKEGWEGGHLLSMSLASTVGPVENAKLVNNQSSWDSPGVIQAIKVWADFQKAGYLPPTPDAITYDNSNALFYSGKAAMNPTGSWLIQSFGSNVKFNVGFVPFPAPNGPGIFSTDVGGGNFVSANTKNPDASIKFLTYLTTQPHGLWEINQYTIPAFPAQTQGATVSSLFHEVIANTSRYAKGTSDVGYNIDVNETDVFNNAMYAGMQSILSGQSTPEQVAQKLQAAATAK